MVQAENVRGGPLEICGMDPLTGFFRTGNCATGPSDSGTHVVCTQVTEAFLTFTNLIDKKGIVQFIQKGVPDNQNSFQ